MSYADAQLDLSSVPVSCLAGANGAGKSALLDATTWAIWEQARSSSDELVRLGEREMWVDVRFEHEGEHYRIRRSRHKQPGKNGSRGQSKGTLDFQVAQNGGESWKSLTGASMRETQKLICELLRMDYETFLNSAYLKQGRADEFTTRTPEKRKQVLADILGLSYYDRLQEHCKEHLRSLKQKKDWLEEELSEFPLTEEHLARQEEEHASKQEQLELCLQEKAIRDQAVSQLNERLRQLAYTKEKIESTEIQLGQDRQDVEVLSSQVEELDKRLAVLKELIADRANIEAEAGEYEKLRTEIEQLDRSALDSQELNKRKIESRAELSNLRSRLELEAAQAEEKLLEAESKLGKLIKDTADSARTAQQFEEYRALVAKEESLARKQEAFSQLSNRCVELKQQIDEVRVHHEADLAQKTLVLSELESLLASGQSLDQQKAKLEQEKSDLDKLETELELTLERGQETKSTIEMIKLKIENLKQAKSENQEKIKELEACSDSTVCPLCSAPIVDRAAVIARYQQSITETESQISQLEQECSDKAQQRITLLQQYKSLHGRLKERKNLDTQIGQYNEKRAAVKRAEENKVKVDSEVNNLARRLAENDYAQVETESLIALKNEIQKLEFDPVLYNNLQGQIRLERSIEPRYHQLVRDMDDLARIKKQMPELKTALEHLKNSLAEESYGKEWRTILQDTEKEIGKLNYDGAKHSALKAALAELLPYSDKCKDLTRALDEYPIAEGSRKTHHSRLTAKLTQIAQLNTDLLVWQNEVEQATDWQDKLDHAEKLARTSALEYDSLSRQLAVLDAQKVQLKGKLSELEDRRKLLAQTGLSISDYSFLAEAFGKKGIQAVIIENAIPESITICIGVRKPAVARRECGTQSQVTVSWSQRVGKA